MDSHSSQNEQVVDQEPSTIAEEVTSKTKKTTSAVTEGFVKRVKENLPSSIKLTSKEVKTICETFIKVLVQQVQSGENVSFTNNMTFKRVIRDDRMHKNPKTGEEVFKPAHYVMVMEVKPTLKRLFQETSVEKAQVEKK